MFGSHMQSPGKLPVSTSITGGNHCQYGVRHWLLCLVTLSLLLVSAPRIMAGTLIQEPELTIQFLITYVKDSDVVFERNFNSYNAVEAAEHIENKYRHFKDEIDTPEQFIELCATRSLMTGKLYLVVTEQGEQIPAGEWLNSVLAAYRLQGEQVLTQAGTQG
jgi:hypothetical protein